jgi:hypothetical protein
MFVEGLYDLVKMSWVTEVINTTSTRRVLVEVTSHAQSWQGGLSSELLQFFNPKPRLPRCSIFL